MKKLWAVFTAIALAIIVPTALLAWGPDRPTYTIENPADHVTFNSITNNPNIGDERNFVGIRETGTTGQWLDSVAVESGHEYTVRMYVHNNADEDLNLVAEDVTARFNLPTTTGQSLQVDGFLTASNSSPTEVYDQATFTSNQDFNLAYVANSLRFENNHFGPNGVALPESIFTSAGTHLGYTSLDGRIPGCFQYAGYVTFTVRPQFAANSQFSVNKRVSRHGANSWVDSYTAQPGEVVDFLVEYENIGSVQQDDVTLRDTLAAGMTYVNGSTIYGNSINPAGVPASDNIANGTGINVGSYAPGANAWAIFSARIVANDQLPVCGVNTLINSARATTGGGSLSDTANIVVQRTCEDTPKELPQTGISEDVASLFGLGAVVTSINYYRLSRKANKR